MCFYFSLTIFLTLDQTSTNLCYVLTCFWWPELNYYCFVLFFTTPRVWRRSCSSINPGDDSQSSHCKSRLRLPVAMNLHEDQLRYRCFSALPLVSRCSLLSLGSLDSLFYSQHTLKGRIIRILLAAGFINKD